MLMHRPHLMPFAAGLLLLVVADMAMALPAANYYVAPQGNDASGGTSPDRPLRWIQTGIKLSAPGDTIYLMPGSHTVKPGDKNIGFKEKGGKPGQPITVTTTGPGVIIDLTDAVQGWGGFRIGNDAEWIVIDGGGTPDPFDESSYRLVIQNAFYQKVQGDARSTANCRPITIQGSSNIVVKNLLGRRSMGAMGVFGNSKNILIENCRCVPAEKMNDASVSHGIYVGSGADRVVIRHCFIKWGGGGRLGFQNNGGGKDVVIENSFITECDQAIKSFNGGHVTAKNCHFWSLADTNHPYQGEVTVQDVVFTAPTETEKAAIFKSIGGRGVKTTAPPLSAVEAPTPPSPERLAEIAAMRTQAQEQIARRLAAMGRLEVVLPYRDQVQAVDLLHATVKDGLEAKLNGTRIQLPWSDLSASHLAGILELLMDGAEDDQAGQGYLCVAILYAIDGADMASAKMTIKAMELDPALDQTLKTSLGRLR